MPASNCCAYGGDWRRFTSWCTDVDDEPLSTAPVLAEILAQYATHLAGAGKAPSTIDRALACDSPPPTERPAWIGQTSLSPEPYCGTNRRERAEAGHHITKASPVTITELRAMVDRLDVGTAAGLRDPTLLVLGIAFGTSRAAVRILRTDVHEAYQDRASSQQWPHLMAAEREPGLSSPHQARSLTRSTGVVVDCDYEGMESQAIHDHHTVPKANIQRACGGPVVA